MRNGPMISVIVPVYKVEAYLARCVDSILAQTFSDFELILVDDGSPDRSGVICDEYAKKDPRIVVIHQKNGGLSAARNAGIDWIFAHSNSRWLSFIDSDDWVHPEYLERLLGAATEYDVSVSICGYISTEGAEPEIAPEDLNPIKWKTEAFYSENNVNATIACAKLYRKECFQSLRYPQGKIREDEFTTYRILFCSPDVAVINAPLYCYYQNPNSIMGSGQSRWRVDIYDAIEQQIEYFRQNGFQTACRCQIRMYLMIVYDKLKKLAEEPGDGQLLKILKERKRRLFPKFARLLNPDDDKDAWILTKVFPKRMKVYWYYRAALRKLKLRK